MGSSGDDQISVDGNPITGTLIGGPTQFFSSVYSSSYRADVTGILSFTTGSNTFSISGANFSYASNGAGILVIIDDGTTQTDIEIKDGNDLAYYNFASPLDTTVPQNFTFAPAVSDRTADISMFFSSVSGTTSTEGFRPSLMKITYSTGGVEYIDNGLDSNDGEEWDTLTRQITIPAGANGMTVQAFSEDRLGIGGRPASFAWTATALSVPVEIVCNGSIGDFVWNDLNGNGIQDAGEPGIPGVTVNLSNESGILATTTTDSNGFYLFDGLCINCYTVEVDESTLPAGMIQTPTMVGDDRSIDNNVNPSRVCLTIDDQEDRTIDFGYVTEIVCNGSIGDFVWNDLNGNGIQDAGEPGIPGVTVNLSNESGILATTTTDSNGFYLFDGLCINCYTVEVDESTLPAGMIQTPTMVGDDRSIDNNVNPSRVCLTIDDQEDRTIDFGYINESIEFSGCTPGYWKNHLNAWGPTGYAPTDIFNDVFSVGYFEGSFNLENALNARGGGLNKVARHGTAALLNANHPSINYPLTSSEVIAAVQSGNVDDLVQYNELSDECPAQEGITKVKKGT
ncbi:MAG: MSCRAMM family adhesin SdrC [ANME-2 cluster archaeon]|nr:MSCRAMM family adhesin SdrC [ANME-2 cluster archaeon]